MDKRNLLRSRYFLYATEFFAGMSVMAIELGASRLLAPYFSSSQIVWTVIIGKNLGADFNLGWIRLKRGINEIRVNGNSSLEFRYRYLLKGGDL